MEMIDGCFSGSMSQREVAFASSQFASTLRLLQSSSKLKISFQNLLTTFILKTRHSFEKLMEHDPEKLDFLATFLVQLFLQEREIKPEKSGKKVGLRFQDGGETTIEDDLTLKLRVDDPLRPQLQPLAAELTSKAFKDFKAETFTFLEKVLGTLSEDDFYADLICKISDASSKNEQNEGSKKSSSPVAILLNETLMTFIKGKQVIKPLKRQKFFLCNVTSLKIDQRKEF